MQVIKTRNAITPFNNQGDSTHITYNSLSDEFNFKKTFLNTLIIYNNESKPAIKDYCYNDGNWVLQGKHGSSEVNPDTGKNNFYYQWQLNMYAPTNGQLAAGCEMRNFWMLYDEQHNKNLTQFHVYITAHQAQGLVSYWHVFHHPIEHEQWDDEFMGGSTWIGQNQGFYCALQWHFEKEPDESYAYWDDIYMNPNNNLIELDKNGETKNNFYMRIRLLTP